MCEALMRWVTAVTLVASLAAAPTLLAQEEPSTAGVFERLEGVWSGSGTLFGRPAGFGMEWRLEWDRRIATLRFDNAFVAEDGARTPVLEAVAYYRARGGGEARGTWIDSRGEILALRFEAGDSTLTVHWEADTESGRTEYLLVEEDVLEVMDFVRSGDDWREFGRALYRRTAP
jgi:hypothetical protein